MNSNPLVAFVAIYWAIIFWKSYFHEWQKNYILSAFWTFIFIKFYNNFHSLSDYSVFSSDFRYFIQVLWATLNQNFARGRYTIFLVRDWLPVRVMDEWKILVCVVCLDGVVGEPLGVMMIKIDIFYKLAPYWQRN